MNEFRYVFYTYAKLKHVYYNKISYIFIASGKILKVTPNTKGNKYTKGAAHAYYKQILD